MVSERITENLVRNIFNKLKYNENKNINIEEQKSQIEEITKLLKKASKSGKGGIGYPEFIVSNIDTPDFIIIFECKADTKKHESLNHDKPVEFAVDGVLHYGKHLSKSYNVIAVAVSGQTKSSLKISNFIFPKGTNTYKKLVNKSNKKIQSIISFDDYIEHGSFDPEVAEKRENDLMTFSIELHIFMRDHAKLTESEKPLLVSGTLIALRNNAFAKSFDVYSPSDLQKAWIRVIKEELKKADIPHNKEYSMVHPYTSIAVHPALGKSHIKYPKGVLHELIKMLNDKVWPFISIYYDFDIVGQFYGEFLKYTGGDKKSLGIVLTPRHITELFSLLANVQKNSKILDICAGTGGFLISAMTYMFKNAITKRDKEKIKKECLIGIENQPQMYALAASNMILRGDGKANLYQGSCFDQEIINHIKNHNCDIGMINPPYSQSDKGLHELMFVKHMLNLLKKGGLGIAIVPMSCAISPHSLKEELLKYHTLDAVMSMPTELFYPVGVVSCIMILKAHIPHNQSNKKTWFGYWKEDGLIKTRHNGRIDQNKNWTHIRKNWVEAYRNRDDVPGECVKQYITHDDEWCAEAYMDTNYTDLTKDNFIKKIKEHVAFKFLYEFMEEASSKACQDKSILLTEKNYNLFPIVYDEKTDTGLFHMSVGTDKSKVLNVLKDSKNKDDIVYEISNTALNNGVNCVYPFKKNDNINTITLATRGNDFKSFYHDYDIIPIVRVINLKSLNFELNKYIALYLCTVFEKSSYKFNYGRVLSGKNILKEKISLPVDKNGEPDWEFMENYIKSLPYSSSI